VAIGDLTMVGLFVWYLLARIIHEP
jgi:hypothetical protein